MADPKNLTARQAHIHRLMLEHQTQVGVPPTIRDLCRMLGLSSTNGVRDHLQALVRKGYATRRGAGRSHAWVAHRRGDSPRYAPLAALMTSLDVKPGLPLGRLLMQIADGRLATISDEDLADAIQAYADRYRGAASHG